MYLNEILSQLNTWLEILLEYNAGKSHYVQENYSCQKPPVMTYFEISQELVSVRPGVG